MGKDIFDKIPLDLDIGWTHILSLDENKVLLMVRDRGHALTVDISKENEEYYINYFIPKICNVDMVNSIKGVRKVNQNSKFTTGVFKVDRNENSQSIVNLIESVPMDKDMVIDDSYYAKSSR